MSIVSMVTRYGLDISPANVSIRVNVADELLAYFRLMPFFCTSTPVTYTIVSKELFLKTCDYLTAISTITLHKVESNS